MPSAVDVAKRELVKVLKTLAGKYKVKLTLSRDSADREVSAAFKRVSLRAHPDKGGEKADFQSLSAANDSWQELLKQRGAPGRPRSHTRVPRASAAVVSVLGTSSERRKFRVASQAVLLTYQGFPAELRLFLTVWTAFLSFLQSHPRTWKVSQWSTTAETNEDETHHLHVMFSFRERLDMVSSKFAFQGVLPNACANDLLGEGFGGRAYQASVDRGHFYVWANKRGTVVDFSGNLCRAGNCEPAWAKETGSDLRGGSKVTHQATGPGNFGRSTNSVTKFLRSTCTFARTSLLPTSATLTFTASGKKTET